VRSSFGVSRCTTLAKLALKLSQFLDSRKPKGGATFIAAVLAVCCAAMVSANAAGRPISYASVRNPSVAAILARAQRGDPAAEARLGWLYATGRGLPQNFAEAAKWYYRAATHGNATAQYELGMAYNKGQGVPRDYVLSYLWLNLSAAQAVGADREYKTTLRDALASKMTPQQLLTAQQLSLKWVKTR
jgi:uncharacterized protein